MLSLFSYLHCAQTSSWLSTVCASIPYKTAGTTVHPLQELHDDCLKLQLQAVAIRMVVVLHSLCSHCVSRALLRA